MSSLSGTQPSPNYCSDHLIDTDSSRGSRKGHSLTTRRRELLSTEWRREPHPSSSYSRPHHQR